MPLSAIIDTNVLVAGISTANPRSASAAVVDRLFADRFVHFASLESLTEIYQVLRLPTVLTVSQFGKRFTPADLSGSRRSRKK